MFSVVPPIPCGGAASLANDVCTIIIVQSVLLVPALAGNDSIDHMIVDTLHKLFYNTPLSLCYAT